MSIHNIIDKIKRGTILDHQTLLNILIILLVGISAFGLGRLSVDSPRIDDSGIAISNSFESKNTQNSDNKIQTNNLTASVVNSTNLITKGKYVASKNGKLYYTLNCSGVKRIKEENKVWFDTPEDAEKAGLTLSSSCK